MKILSVIGARPQFVKASVVSVALREFFTEIIVHTGQHYDDDMSLIFFRELGIPNPNYNLGIGSGSHGKQTGAMLGAIEEVILKEHPDIVLVYGDTNSTLAGALAAAKLSLPLAHVEAGLRSFNRTMPEEVNRVVTDHCAQFLFCPTQKAVDNLVNEGVTTGVHLTGDVMFDALRTYLPLATADDVFSRLGITPKEYILATVHRAANTDDPERLKSVLDCLTAAETPVIFPIHPRTKNAIERLNYSMPPNVKVIEPVGYLQMLVLEKHALTIMTDSGGVQKEAYMLGVPCITLRTETEWEETLTGGWNILTDLDVHKVTQALANPPADTYRLPVFGDGHSSTRIAEILKESVS